MNDLLTIKQLAGKLNVSIHTLYKWVNLRMIPYIKLGHALRFDPAVIQRWLDDQKVEKYEYK